LQSAWHHRLEHPQLCLQYVPEHVFALAFALRRNILAYRDDVRAGRWQECDQFCFFDHPIRDMRGSTLGIVGYGAIGKAVARIAEAFGQKVLAYDIFPQAGLTDFETLLRESDIITLHLPLTPETKNMIGARELKLMKKDAILITRAAAASSTKQPWPRRSPTKSLAALVSTC